MPAQPDFDGGVEELPAARPVAVGDLYRISSHRSISGTQRSLITMARATDSASGVDKD